MERVWALDVQEVLKEFNVFLAFNMRSERGSIFKLGLFTNKAMIIWAAASLAALMIGVNLPLIQQALKTTALSINEWGVVIVLAISGAFWMEIKKQIMVK